MADLGEKHEPPGTLSANADPNAGERRREVSKIALDECRDREAVIRARGGNPCVVHTGTWGGSEALNRLQAHNAEVRRVRARIEKVFGTCKRCYGLRRMRWLGLAKAGVQVRLTAIAYNLRRSWGLLAQAAA